MKNEIFLNLGMNFNCNMTSGAAIDLLVDKAAIGTSSIGKTEA